MIGLIESWVIEQIKLKKKIPKEFVWNCALGKRESKKEKAKEGIIIEVNIVRVDQ